MNTKMTRNQTITLRELGAASPIMVFSIGWVSKAKEGLLNSLMQKTEEADLDVSCVVYDANNDRIDTVWYAQLKSKCGAIRHTGDGTVGEEEKDDETITLDLTQLNEMAQNVFFVISSFGGQTFAQVENAYWRLFDGQTKEELARYDLGAYEDISAMIVMQMQKQQTETGYEWTVKALKEPATGKNIQEIFPEIRSLLVAA